MQQHYGEQPPPDYFETVRAATEAEAAEDRNATAVTTTGEHHDVEVAADGHDHTPAVATVEAVEQLHDVMRTTLQYLRHPEDFEGTVNASNSFKGFIDIVYEHKKCPLGLAKNILYKVMLLIYYLINFVYSRFAAGIQGIPVSYYLIYLLISLTGLSYEVIVIIAEIRNRKNLNRPFPIENHQPREAWTSGTTPPKNYSYKAKSVFVDYVISSLGEFLIYPILICNLYGFINERAWQFDNGISTCNFLLFLYSVIMDAIYMKFFMIWLLMGGIIRATYAKYHELVHPRKPLEWKRYFIPIYMTEPFAITTALTQWFMIGIIGVRIFIDNFTPDKDDTNSNIPSTGNYRVSPFTGYMIGFAFCLPFFSLAIYVLLNKLWFYEIYSCIHHLTVRRVEATPPQLLWNIKLVAFIRDPLAYLSVAILMVLFIMFTVGAYSPDYNSSDYEVASSARNALQGLRPCFIIFFLLSNLQATIIFTFSILTITSMMVCVLCIVLACLCSNNSK